MKTRLIEHPLIHTRLTTLRAAETSTAEFRATLHDIGRLMCFEVCRDLPTRERLVTTPLTQTRGAELARPVVLVPILRAGLGLLQGFVDLLSEAAIGTIGMYRDEVTLEPKSYFSRMPDNLAEAEVILIDPMLATGCSSVEAARQLRSAGASRLRFACLIAAPEGIEAFHRAHPDIDIYTACIDEGLDENAFIVPGLGDAGDRYFAT